MEHCGVSRAAADGGLGNGSLPVDLADAATPPHLT